MREKLIFLLVLFVLVMILPGVSYGVTPYTLGYYEAKCYSGWWSVSPSCWQTSSDTVFYTPYDYAIGYRIDTGDEYTNGETFTFEWIYPNGYSQRQSATYSESTGCWSGPWVGGTCGRVRFLSWIWSSGKGVGTGTLNVYHNSQVWFTGTYEIKGLEFTKVSGDQTAITEAVAPEPIRIRLLDWDGNGFGGKRVEFYASSTPRRSTGTGVMTSPDGSPSSYISVYTDTAGYAQAYVVLGDMKGNYIFEAFCPDADSTRFQNFAINANSEAELGVVRMSAIGDVELENITDPVYVAGFNPDGSMMETKLDPIADYPNDDFWLDVELGAFPYKPIWTPQVDYSYRISGLGSSGKASFAGWGAGIRIFTDARRITSRTFGDHELKLTFVIKDGGGRTVKRQSLTLPLKALPKVEVTRPTENEDFDYGADYVSTEVPFNARVVGLTNQQLSWNAAVDYQTSGGRRVGQHTETFTSTSDIEQPHGFAAVGGRLIVNATTTVNGVAGKSDNVNATITGVAIPNAVITQRLLNLYSDGNEPRLLTGLSMVESSYRQFNPNLTIYGRTDRWPTESYATIECPTGGCYIGLMMVATTMERAWNWIINTQDAAVHFKEEIARSGRHIEYVRSTTCPNIRDLTAEEHENNALSTYNTGSLYYYVANASCEWEVANHVGVTYANDVRNAIVRN